MTRRLSELARWATWVCLATACTDDASRPTDASPDASASGTATSDSSPPTPTVSATTSGITESDVTSRSDGSSSTVVGSNSTANSTPNSEADAQTTLTSEADDSVDSLDASLPRLDAGTDSAVGDGGRDRFATKGDADIALCAYYQRCAPALFAYYGGEANCLATQTINAATFSSVPVTSETLLVGWNRGCVQGIGTSPCAEVADRETDAFDHVQFTTQAMIECGPSQEGLGCTDREQCGEGLRCSAQPGQCGECQSPGPSDGCGSLVECQTGQTCHDDQCVARKQPGTTCDEPTECVGLRCDGTCLEPAPAGTSCQSPNDCDQYLWCDNGSCAPPAAENAACDEQQFYACQGHLLCIQGTCQLRAANDVAVGGPCLTSANCIAGAACDHSLCVASNDECSADSQCSEGQYCDGTCLPRRDAEASCSKDWACKSDMCVDGKCLDPNACRETAPETTDLDAGLTDDSGPPPIVIITQPTTGPVVTSPVVTAPVVTSPIIVLPPSSSPRTE